MKRLIALLVGLTVLLSMSLTSFAAFTDAIELNADGVTYTAALSDEAATANAGKQTTIVAYKGDTIEVGSIQYINQEAATSFTFQLMDELTENVKVVMGGEAIDKQEVGTIFYGSQEPEPTPDPTYTVSGTTSTTSANKDFTAKLYAGEVVAYEAVVTAGTYTFSNVAAGDYTLAIDKAAHIDFAGAVSVAADKVVADIALIAGDTSADDMVDVADFGVVSRIFLATAGDSNFSAEADTNGDNLIDVADFGVVSRNFLATAADYPAIN